jgi:hypothetical protein
VHKFYQHAGIITASFLLVALGRLARVCAVERRVDAGVDAKASGRAGGWKSRAHLAGAILGWAAQLSTRVGLRSWSGNRSRNRSMCRTLIAIAVLGVQDAGNGTWTTSGGTGWYPTAHLAGAILGWAAQLSTREIATRRSWSRSWGQTLIAIAVLVGEDAGKVAHGTRGWAGSWYPTAHLARAIPGWAAQFGARVVLARARARSGAATVTAVMMVVVMTLGR